jgi:hypothetical protein
LTFPLTGAPSKKKGWLRNKETRIRNWVGQVGKLADWRVEGVVKGQVRADHSSQTMLWVLIVANVIDARRSREVDESAPRPNPIQGEKCRKSNLISCFDPIPPQLRRAYRGELASWRGDIIQSRLGRWRCRHGRFAVAPHQLPLRRPLSRSPIGQFHCTRPRAQAGQRTIPAASRFS